MLSDEQRAEWQARVAEALDILRENDELLPEENAYTPEIILWARTNVAVDERLTRLGRENEALRQIVVDFHWMARRYCSGRSSYATSLFNDHVRALLRLGVKLKRGTDDTIWALDGMGRELAGLTPDEWDEAVEAERAHDRDYASLMHDKERFEKACYQIEHEVTQILGRALGYPWYKDDLANFPNATEADGVCVGEHVAASIAEEAAGRIRSLQSLVDQMCARSAAGALADQLARALRELEQARDQLGKIRQAADAVTDEWYRGSCDDELGGAITRLHAAQPKRQEDE
jgi:hypothetical protein